MKIARSSAAFVATVAICRIGAADVPIAKIDNWELFTNGRVNAFFSYGQGDSTPLPLQMGENITPGGGLDTTYDNIPVLGPDGMALRCRARSRACAFEAASFPTCSASAFAARSAPTRRSRFTHRSGARLKPSRSEKPRRTSLRFRRGTSRSRLRGAP